MTISRKYSGFVLLTTIGTAIAIFFAMRAVMRTSLEQEILKRGETAAEAFAHINAPYIRRLPDETAAEALRHNLLALAKDPDIMNARLADRHHIVVASLRREEVSQALPAFFTAPDAPSRYIDPAQNAFHFRTIIQEDDRQVGTLVLTLSRTPLDAPLGEATERALIFAAGVVAIMSIFGLLLVRREVRPLKAMGVAFDKIAKGDFSQRVPQDRRDEIGDLASAFNFMLERAELMFQYNDKMIIEHLIADPSLAKPGGRQRDLTVVFGDMRGYTAMSNRKNADQVVRIVNTYFHLFIECIANWGGMVDKTMGDAIMSIFERADGDAIDSHKRRALLSTCYMKAASRVLNRLLYIKRAQGEELDIEPREFGFALATGRAIVGNIGSVRRMDYTVCGRVVNLASRLEGLTKNGEVIIDNFSLKGTQDLVRYETLPAVQPKGFGEAEKVIPHRIIEVVEEEMHRLRMFLKRLFSYSFVREMLMPRHLSAGEEQAWCKEAELVLLELIAEMSADEFFLRVDIETGKPLPEIAQTMG